MSVRLRNVLLGVVLCVPCTALAQSSVNDGIENILRERFSDAPIMVEIARCESEFRQYDASGIALSGGTGGNMIGVFQINAPVHSDFARDIGMDVYTLDGNVNYARYLYDSEGTRPWNSSGTCWRDAVLSDDREFSRDLELGMEGEDVQALQKFLNENGFSVASNGAGSPGNETAYFGPRTRAALSRFQESHGISPTAGYFGPITRGHVASR